MLKNQTDSGDEIGLVVMFPEYSDKRGEDINGVVMAAGLDKIEDSLEVDLNNKDKSKSGDNLSEGKDSSDDDEDEAVNEFERNKLKMYRKREFVLEELLDTEKAYLQDLSQIVEGYMELVKKGEIEKPASLLGKEMVVFGNVHQIHDWHSKTFLPEMEETLKNPRRLANTFIKHGRKFDIYVKYCENKPKSEDLVYENLSYFETLRESLGHKFQLTDMLIKPVQRIMKYKLLFKDILKYTERAGDDVKEIQKALEVMCIIPKAANDMMNVSRLQGFNGKVTAQGRLLLQDNLLVAEVDTSKTPSKAEKSQFQNRRTFLFEQIMIFSEQPDKKKNPLTRPSYLYRNSIRVNKMLLKTDIAEEPMTFLLVNRAPEAQTRFFCRAPDAASKKNWVTQINLLLEMQNDLLKALQSPIEYQNEWKNNSSSNLLENSYEKLEKTNESKKRVKPSKSKTRSFKNLFIRQSSVQHDRTNGKPHGYLSVPAEQKDQLLDIKRKSAEPKTSGVEIPKMKWSLLRKRTSKNNTPTTSPTTDDTKSLEDQNENNASKAENQNTPGDNQKNSIHSSIDNLLFPEGDSGDSKGSNKRKNSLLDNLRSSKCDETSQDEKEGEDESLKMPKTAGVVWNNLRWLFKRPSITVTVAKEINNEEDGTSEKNKDLNSQTSKESIEETDEEKLIAQAPVFIEGLENTTGIEKSHVTLVSKVKSSQPLVNQNYIRNFSNQHLLNFNHESTNKENENNKKNDKTYITWFDPKNEVISNSLQEILEFREIENNQIESRLTLYNISTHQSGVYRCQARNGHGSVSSEASLKISPEIKSKPKLKVNAALNEELNEKLLCLSSSLSSSSSSFSRSQSKANRVFQVYKDPLKWSQGFEGKFTEVSLLNQSTFLSTVKKYVHRKNHSETVVGKFYSKFFRSKESVMNEIMLTDSLDHPSLVKILELFEIKFGYITIYPYFENGRLFDYIDSVITHNKESTSSCIFTDTLALQISMQLFSALNCLHNCNIIHLKINPENLLVDLSEPTLPSLKVINFSQAKQLDSTLDDIGYVHSFSGDAEFTAPEILQHIPVTCYADVWSAGVVLYAMLTGISPFHREDLQRTCQKVVDNSYYVDALPNEPTKKLISSIFTMPPSQRPSASMCFEKCRLLSRTPPPTTLSISPSLLPEFLKRRSLF